MAGGTGSFGNAVLNRFLETDIKEIRVFSRDELKQVPSCEFFPVESVKNKLLEVTLVRNELEEWENR